MNSDEYPVSFVSTEIIPHAQRWAWVIPFKGADVIAIALRDGYAQPGEYTEEELTNRNGEFVRVPN